MIAACAAASLPVSLQAQDEARTAASASVQEPLRLSARCTCANPADVISIHRFTSPTDINEAGLIAGTSWLNGNVPHHAAVRVPAGWVDDLYQTDSSESRALALNEEGTVVGERRTNPPKPFRWTTKHGFEELPLPPNLTSGSAVSVDGSGNILVTDDRTAWVWTASTRIYVALPGLGGIVSARRMNEDGDVVGMAEDAQGRRNAVIWRRATYELSILPTPSSSNGRTVTWPSATALNRQGTVVGTAVIGDRQHAVAWVGPDHAFRELGAGGRPLAVNDHDLAVGSPPASVMTGVLVLWDVASREEIRLPILHFYSDEYEYFASDVNNAGTPVGMRYMRHGGGFPNPAIRFPQVVCADP